jgi:hypothetical protein
MNYLPETTPAFLVKRTGLNPKTLHQRLRHHECPPWRVAEHGATGRVVRVQLTQEAFNWLLRPVDETKQTNSKHRTRKNT